MQIRKILILSDIAFFAAVIVVLALGLAAEPFGLSIIVAWFAIFLATVVSFSLHLSQGLDDWYQYGSLLITGILVAMVLGLILGYDVYTTALLMPFAVMGVLVLNWMFTDASEEAIERDLDGLRKELV